MLIKVLDSASLGEDTPIKEYLSGFGELQIYANTTDCEMEERIRDAEVIVLNKIKITERVLSYAKALKLICVFATGYDNIDLNAARRHGVAVCNVPAYSTESVAQFTLSTVLALASHLFEYRRFVTDGEYTRLGVPNRLIPVYHEIAGKTWGIIGYGNIGKAVGRVAERLGARVIVNKRTPVDGVECVDVDTLCRESDIITLHCPLNDGTRGIISRERLKLMKPEVILVNEARGAVLDEAAVAEAVREGRIAAFGSDVYSTEPFCESHPYTSIMKLDNVILTPHAAWGSYEARCRCISVIADNISAFVDGKILNRVDI